MTFYFALSIETVSLTNFGLTGTNLGIFLVCINLSVFILSVSFALSNYRVQRQERARIESQVSICIYMLMYCVWAHLYHNEYANIDKLDFVYKFHPLCGYILCALGKFIRMGRRLHRRAIQINIKVHSVT